MNKKIKSSLFQGNEFVVQGAMENSRSWRKKDFTCSMSRANLVAFRSISCAIIRRVPSTSTCYENRVFPSHRGRGKNTEESRSWNILARSAWVRLSGTGIRFVWRRWTARRRRTSVEPLVQPYNSVNFIELPSPFLCPPLLRSSLEHSYPSGLIQPRKRSDRRRIRFLRLITIFCSFYSTSFSPLHF